MLKMLKLLFVNFKIKNLQFKNFVCYLVKCRLFRNKNVNNYIFYFKNKIQQKSFANAVYLKYCIIIQTLH